MAAPAPSQSSTTLIASRVTHTVLTYRYCNTYITTMPAYDYTCQDCGESFEIRMSMSAYSEGATPTCTACGSNRVERAFVAVNVLTGSRGASSTDAGCSSGGFT